MSHWIALMLAIAGNVGANIAFKHFVQNTPFSRSWSTVSAVLSQPTFWIGCALAGMLMVCYLYAIRSIPLSLAYTFATSVSIAAITCAGVLIFGETMSLRAGLGIAVIIGGIVLVTTG